MNNQAFYFLLLLVLISGCGQIDAQEKVGDNTLHSDIAKMDSILFDAFNRRDTVTFKKFFTEDLEFYHDEGGLTGYQHTIEFMRSTAKNNNGLKRTLGPGSLAIYPFQIMVLWKLVHTRFVTLKTGNRTAALSNSFMCGRSLVMIGRSQE